MDVLILQHPLEVANAKGSARLLHLSLQSSRLEIGEAFAEDTLHALIVGCRRPQSIADTPDVSRSRKIFLLYPETADHVMTETSFRPGREEPSLHEEEPFCLVVLDATWRKSRKMLYLNPLLQTLPRFALRDMPASQYLIRKAHAPNQMSTLEAACYALMQLERNTEKYAPLLAAFNGFVAQQDGYRTLGMR